MYWQWIYSKPRDENPLRTGIINNQEFISLPCTGGGEDCNRKIALKNEDTKKDILIPVFAAEFCTGEIPGATDEQLRLEARSMADPVQMEASVDGKELTPHYVETKPFDLTIPENHSLDDEKIPAGSYRAVSCGYWYKLNPLSRGKHMVKFGGSGSHGFFTKVAYEILVD